MLNVYVFTFFIYGHMLFFLFFFNDTATTEIYTLSLHDALPICQWLYYRSGENNKRDNAFAMMLSRLGLLNNESALEDIFLELLEADNIDISDDGLGIKLL